MMPLMRGLLKKLMANLLRGGAFLLLFFLSGCAKTGPASLAPYVIKKVTAAPIDLPVMIVHSAYGTKKVHPSIWNAKTLKFSEGMPQKVVVKKGESLFTLSKRYAVPLPLIIAKNKIKPPFSIYPGQVLTLVGPQVHIVQKGENLYEVAALHQVSLSALTRQNNLSNAQPLQTGQRLILPAPQAPILSDGPPSKVVPPKEIDIAHTPVGRVEPAPISDKPQISTEKKEISSAPWRLVDPVPRRAGTTFAWPVKGQLISRFGPKGAGLVNDGVNIAAAQGTPVRSAENGVVVYQGADIKSYGNLVLVKHEGGWMTAYAHLDKAGVEKGQIIKKQEILGYVGASGFVRHPQLHFELRKDGKPQDPLSYF